MRSGDPVLPLDGFLRLYVEGIVTSVASGYGRVVDEPRDADVAVLQISAPYEQR